MGQIMFLVFEAKGSPIPGIVLFALLPFLAVWTCSCSSYTYAARCA